MMTHFTFDPGVYSAFSSGVLALGMWFGGLFFWHAYRQTRDRFFIFLALSFWVLMIDRITWGLVGRGWFVDPQHNLRTIVYAIRFVGFAIIAFGIVDKNRRAKISPLTSTKLRVIPGKRRSA